MLRDCRMITVGAEMKSNGWLVVAKFGNQNAAYGSLKAIDAADEKFEDFDKLKERVDSLTSLIRVYRYLVGLKVPVAETGNSPYNAEGENGADTYSREYIFAGADDLLIHVHWKKGSRKFEVSKAHFKSTSSKFEVGKSASRRQTVMPPRGFVFCSSSLVFSYMGVT
jgi:hypothetical protein